MEELAPRDLRVTPDRAEAVSRLLKVGGCNKPIPGAAGVIDSGGGTICWGGGTIGGGGGGGTPAIDGGGSGRVPAGTGGGGGARTSVVGGVGDVVGVEGAAVISVDPASVPSVTVSVPLTVLDT